MSISSRRMGSSVTCPRCQQTNTVPDEEGAAKTLAARKAHKAKVAAEAAKAQIAAPTPAAVAPPPLAKSSAAAAAFAADDDTELVYEDELPGAIAEEEFNVHKVAVSRSLLYVHGGLLLLVALGAFALGMVIGAGPKPRGKGPVVDRPCTLKGSVLCREQRDGPAAPDRGAVVFLLPEKPPASGPWASAGLRPSDPPPPPDHAGLKALRDAGGAYARADKQGVYQLTVPHPGTYRVLVISALARREGGADVFKDDRELLGQYFSDPVELIRDSKYACSTASLTQDEPRNFELP